VGRLLNFVKSTIVGGIFVLVPVVLLSIAIGEAVKLAYTTLHPLVEMLPLTSVSTVSLAFLLGIVAVVLCCFFAGLVARTAISQYFVGRIEGLILTFVPGYGLMKSMGQGWVGANAKDAHQPTLVRLDDAWQLGFVMDTLPDGRQVVFLPDTPTPWSGTLLIVNADRLEPVPLTTKQTIECLRRLGANARNLWEAPRAA
jgi:uncharacterized membrane protein